MIYNELDRFVPSYHDPSFGIRVGDTVLTDIGQAFDVDYVTICEGRRVPIAVGDEGRSVELADVVSVVIPGVDPARALEQIA